MDPGIGARASARRDKEKESGFPLGCDPGGRVEPGRRGSLHVVIARVGDDARVEDVCVCVCVTRQREFWFQV